MKKCSKTNCILLLILLFFVLSISRTSARFIPSRQEGSPLINSNEVRLQEDDFSSVTFMGLEKCGDRDEDCEKRRMVAEAHLDYIYTQNLKP